MNRMEGKNNRIKYFNENKIFYIYNQNNLTPSKKLFSVTNIYGYKPDFKRIGKDIKKEEVYYELNLIKSRKKESAITGKDVYEDIKTVIITENGNIIINE